MKRILCILLAVGMTVVFSGCSGGEEETSSEVSSAVTVEPSLPEPEPEPEPVYEARIVNVDQGSFANIREKPDISSAVIGTRRSRQRMRAPMTNGRRLNLTGQQAMSTRITSR